MNNEYWIPFSVTSETSVSKIGRALDACYGVYTWTFRVLKEQWLETLEIPRDRDIRLNLTKFAYEHDLLRHVKRYALNRAAEKAASEFRQGLRVGEGNKVEFPEPMLFTYYTDFSIQNRKVWRKYLTQYGGISTSYGMLMLDSNWKNAFIAQANEMSVTTDYLPYLWHSATIRSEEAKYSLKFNFHNPTSVQGKKAKRRLRLENENGG